MRLRIGVVFLMVLLSVGLRAGERPAGKPETFESLKKEMEAAQKKYIDDYIKETEKTRKAQEKAIAEAKTEDEKKATIKKGTTIAFSMSGGPGPQFAPRFLAWAEKHPKDPEAFDALLMALQTSMGPNGKAGDTWVATLKVLKANYTTDPKIGELLRMLSRQSDEASAQFLRAVIEQNPDRRTKGLASRALARGKQQAVEMSTLLKTNEAFRQFREKELGKEGVEKQIASFDRLKSEADELHKQFQATFGDLFPDLSIGKPVPEVMSQGLDGKKVKLSDHKGKVVVLDIWATWCGPCRAMIPHEREMTGRLKDKPFVLVSVSVDEEKETLTKFLDKEKMPWTHWWNGSKGGIIEDWDVAYYPTIYVIDAKGVIRFKDLRGEKLEEAVEKLLKEAETTH